MDPVTLDLSKAQPLPQAPVQLDMSKAQPLPQPEDTRSLYQKAKDNFNAATQGAKPGDGAIKSFFENVGEGGGQFVRAIAHPVRTLDSVDQTMLHPLDQAHAEVDALRANPSKFIGNAIGQAGTGAILGGAADLAGNRAVAATNAVSDAASAAKAKLYPTSQSLAPATSAARNLSKALVVDPAGVNNFVRAATDEAGTVVDFAQKNNLPINSKVDFANAAKQTADTVQSHFDGILDPQSSKVNAVPASYRGTKVGEGPNATLGAINDRINAISQELKPNFRKATAAQTSTANVSDADLIAEKSALTNIIDTKLASSSGLSPDDIAAIRQQAGKLRTIADESQASANRDLTAAGKQAMGTTTSAVGTKAGIIDRGLQMVQGGPEVIGNRQVNAALKDVQAKPLNLPQPTPPEVIPPAPRPPTGGPSTTISGPDYTPDPNAASALRDKISARQAAPIKQMQQWANNGAAKLIQHDPNLTTADIELLNKSPVGKQILVKASSLTPGSPAMESLFPQIQAALSAK